MSDELTTSNSSGTVAVVDWNWKGHHPTYFKHFCLALLHSGYVVVALCPEPAEVDSWIRSRNDNQIPCNRYKSARLITPNCNLIPSRIRSAIQARLRLKRIVKLLGEWPGIHHVFFACMCPADFLWPRRLPDVGRIKWAINWSGLYLDSSAFHNIPLDKIELTLQRNLGGILPWGLCRGLMVLDEAIQQRIVSTGMPRVVGFLPDFADLSYEPDSDYEIRLRAFANANTLVGLIGRISPYKGLTTLIEAASDSRNSRIRFAVVGEIPWDEYSPEDARFLRNRLNNLKNVMIIDKCLPDGKVFNGCINAFDIVYAAYHDFDSSSNVLTKAAFFRKPILVSAGGLMAARVQRYRLGIVISQRSASALTEAIHNIRGNRLAAEDLKEGSMEFEKMFSIESFEERFHAFMAEIVGQKRS